MAENVVPVPMTFLPLALEGDGGRRVTKLPVYRVETSGKLVAYDWVEDAWYAVDDESQLIRPPEDVPDDIPPSCLQDYGRYTKG